MKRSIFLLPLLLLFSYLHSNEKSHFTFQEGVVFVTVADTEHYPLLLHLIKSIHRHHNNNLRQIAIFDLGFTDNERSYLNQMDRVVIHDIECVNPYLFIKFRTRLSKSGKPVRGLYSWKPVVIKQALEMFPYIYYLDAGLSLKCPADILFEYIKQNGCLFTNCGHSIYDMYTQTAQKAFSLNHPERSWIMGNWGLSAGIQGLSRDMLHDYVLPIYELAKDINNFIDDGTAPGGFGYARHDQLLFSIQANLLGLTIHSFDHTHYVKIADEEVPFKLCDYLKTKPQWWIDYYD